MVRLRTCLVVEKRSVAMLYASAEIPPAGASSGFDSAAMVVSSFAVAPLCRSAQNDTEGIAFCEM